MSQKSVKLCLFLYKEPQICFQLSGLLSDLWWREGNRNKAVTAAAGRATQA